MKQYLYRFPLYLISLILFSCQPDTSQSAGKNILPEASENKASATTQEILEVDEALVKECTEYWAEIQQLQSLASDYYAKEFLPKALANPELPEQNREFLLALQGYLGQSKEELFPTLAIEHILLPVFKLEENELGIIGFPVYDIDNPEHTDISLERKMLARHKLVSSYGDTPSREMMLHPAFADSLLGKRDRAFYTYTTQRQVKTRITDFGSYQGECLQYYNYLLDSKPFSNKDNVLFASRYNLDLVYKGEPEVNALLKSQYKKQCQDCPNSGELSRTFTSLKGVDGLYFTYADTFPLNNELETPLRGLVMRMGERFVYLWYAEVDLVGCSCI